VLVSLRHAAQCRCVPVNSDVRSHVNQPGLLEELAAYVAVLEHSAEFTHRAEDRLAYSRHLAAAARMFRSAHAGALDDLKSLVETEVRAFGWSYLSDAEGEGAEKAFACFAKLVAGTRAT
jgi:hypothetical protein